MSNPETVKKINPLILLWRSFTQPSQGIEEDLEESDTLSIEIQQSDKITEDVKKELEESLKNVKTINERLNIVNFEKTPRVRKAEWNTQGNTRRNGKEQTQDNQELSQEKEEEQELG
jgi:hypothetical protein